eukprot:7692837-Alexandrium_andersonii.AAC.1
MSSKMPCPSGVGTARSSLRECPEGALSPGALHGQCPQLPDPRRLAPLGRQTPGSTRGGSR